MPFLGLKRLNEQKIVSLKAYLSGFDTAKNLIDYWSLDFPEQCTEDLPSGIWHIYKETQYEIILHGYINEEAYQLSVYAEVKKNLCNQMVFYHTKLNLLVEEILKHRREGQEGENSEGENEEEEEEDSNEKYIYFQDTESEHENADNFDIQTFGPKYSINEEGVNEYIINYYRPFHPKE